MKKSLIKILLIEQDRLLSTTLVDLLEKNHYTIERVNNGQAGLELAATVEYDLILLGLQIPNFDRMSLCRQLRAQGYHKPILFLTLNASDTEAIAGFEAGADDYISYPFTTEVLLARIRTLLRRSTIVFLRNSAQNSSTTTLAWGNLCLDIDAGRVTFCEQVISLTPTEYKLIELFLQNPNRIFSRSAILDRLWGLDDVPTDRAINTHIKDLRKKLKAGGLAEEIIETVYGMGYRLKPRPQSQPSNSNPAALLDSTGKHQSDQGHLSPLTQGLEQSQGIFNERVAVLEQAKAALLAGTLEKELQQAAQQESHKLAGSMASFGYPEGSKFAQIAEHLLMGNQPFTSKEISQFSDAVTALWQELAKPPVTLTLSPVSPVLSHQVLVIEDDVTLIERLKADSETWGIQINIASNLTLARSHLALSRPDVMVLDLKFPETEEDGLILLRELTARFPDLPIIVLTGQDHLTARLAVSQLGIKKFLPKPATSEQIFRAISRILTKTKASPAKVLMVDDDQAVLAHLSALLTPWGLETISLTETQKFWDVLIATSPNLVILDLEMPQVSGLELCQVVRQDIQWGDLPILVVTGHTDTDSLQQAFMAGADDFIIKPVLGPELVTRVLSRIERSRWRSMPYGST